MNLTFKGSDSMIWKCLQGNYVLALKKLIQKAS